MPRGRRSDFAPNQYVNWVQAQPAVNRARHHAASLPLEKALRCFPLTQFMRLQQKNLPREVFLGCAKRQFAEGAFLLQKPPLLQADFRLAKFTRKGA